MKKMLSVLLSLALLCSLFSGCSQTAAPGDTSSESVSGAEPETEHVIRIVTDLGTNNNYWTRVGDSTIGAQNAIDQSLRVLGELPPGYRVEVEVLPIDEENFKSRLTSLRTEIMAGDGPDIFVLCTDYLGWMVLPHDPLFPNPQKAMKDGYFLPLDDYLQNAQFMELDKMNKTVLEAGRFEDTQFVLPIRYSYSAARISDDVADPGLGWNEVMNGDDEVMKTIYANAAQFYLHNVFPEPIDYDAETLAFSEEELYDALAAALQYYSFPEDTHAKGAITGFQVQGDEPGLTDIWKIEEEETVSYIPLRNTEGGVTAGVTSYIAINRNSKYPDEAFHVVDVMMSKKFQSGKRFWPNDEPIRGTCSSLPVFSFSVGVSIYDDLMQKSQPLNYMQYIEDAMFPTYCEMRDKITDARIITNVDTALSKLLMDLDRDIQPGDELKELVSKAYVEMTQMVGEM